MPTTLSDADFLREMNFKEEFICHLDSVKPVFSIAYDFTTTCTGGFHHLFTQDPISSLKSEFLEHKYRIVDGLNESLAYANEQIAELRSGKKMLFSYSEEEYAEKFSEITTKLNFIEALPEWYETIKAEDVGHFNFEYDGEYTQYNVLKVRIGDVKQLYLFNKGFKQPEVILSKDELYRSFIEQTIDSILERMQKAWNESIVPSIEEAKSKQTIMQSLYNTYEAIPVGSLICVTDRAIPFVFGRKTSPDIVPSSSDYSSFRFDTYSLELNTVFLGYDPRINDKSIMQIELRNTFPLNPSVKIIPAPEERAAIETAIKTLGAQGIHVQKDMLTEIKDHNDDIRRIYEGLNID